MLIFNQEDLSQECIKVCVGKVDTWLESSAVISQDKDNIGAVAGAIDANNAPLYWYSEIAGYYLSYLSYRAKPDNHYEKLKKNSLLVLNYQKKIWSSNNPPSTRMYSDSHIVDWRNQGLFIFDLAMLLRGIADCAKSFENTQWNGAVVANHVDNFLSTSQKIQAVQWLHEAPLDTLKSAMRWSTQSGSYQLKVIAALLRYARTFQNKGLEEKILSAANILAHNFNRGDFSLHNPHSICYALEGALLLQDELPLNLAIGKKLLEELVHNALNTLTSDHEAIRSDVIAQLLRLTCCEPYFNFVWATKLAQHLQAAIQPDGSLYFTISPYTITHKNVWPALFARQALDYYTLVLKFGQPLTAQEYGSLF